MPAQAVVVTFNSAAHIAACLESLHANRADVIVVDNGSTDDTLGILSREFPATRVLVNPQNNYGGALNLGMRATAGEFVIAANADVVFSPGSIAGLVECLQQHPRAGVVGPQQVFPDGNWQQSYGRIPGVAEGLADLFGVTSLQFGVRRIAWPRRVDRGTRAVGYVSGAVLALRREAFESIGGFDESFAFYAEETDLCLRLRKAGWQVLFHPSVSTMHVRGGSSRSADKIPEKYLLMLSAAKASLVRKHRGILAARVYAWLEWLHSLKMYLFLRAFGMVSARPRLRNHAEMFRTLQRAWRDLS